MTAITFDTLKFVKTLKAAGFEEKQAEALAEAQTDVFDKSLENLATKQDFKELELRIAETKVDLIKWIVGIAGGQAALIVTLLKLID